MSVALHPAASAYAPPAEAARCLDCDTSLVGHFCHECGARRAEERPLTVARFGREAVHEVSSVDSVTVRTLRSLLARPGEMTVHYVAGRARQYLSPLRLYVLLFGLMMAFSNATGISGRVEAHARAQLSATQRSELDRLARKAHRGPRVPAGAPARDIPAEITGKIFHYSFNPWLRLLDPLVIGGVLMVLFRGRRRSYAEHAVFALHLLAFNAALTVVTMSLHDAVDWRKPLDSLVTALHWAALGAYFFAAARVVHGETRARTGLKTLGFVAGAQAAMVIVPGIVAIVATVQALTR
jgi:hypothetical protein